MNTIKVQLFGKKEGHRFSPSAKISKDLLSPELASLLQREGDKLLQFFFSDSSHAH
jgi:hypothetical protein